MCTLLLSLQHLPRLTEEADTSLRKLCGLHSRKTGSHDQGLSEERAGESTGLGLEHLGLSAGSSLRSHPPCDLSALISRTGQW